jgi:hypothetical protein
VTSAIQTQINNINATSSTNSAALSGINYDSGTDTTNISNNVIIPSGKTVSFGAVSNVETSITSLNASVSSLNSSVSTLNTQTTGITYNSGSDTTTVDNKVTITGDLVVQGMNIKNEIDALDSSFTTGTLNSTNATITNLQSDHVSSANYQVNDSTYNSTAISAPPFRVGLGVGTADNNAMSQFNQALYSWWSTAFVDTCFHTVQTIIDHRTGNFTTNGLITCANMVVSAVTTLATVVISTLTATSATITNLTATHITSPSGSDINITTTNNRHLYLNNNKGLNAGDVYINDGSSASNFIVPKGSVTIQEGNLQVNSGFINTTSHYSNATMMETIWSYPATDKTYVKTKLLADYDTPMMGPGTYFGVWFVDAGLANYKLDRFRPVPCSCSAAGSSDDIWIVCAGYKVVLYYYAGYAILAGQRPWSGGTDTAAQTRTIDNTNGTGYVCATSNDLYGSANQVGSCKVYYRNTEIVFANF